MAKKPIINEQRITKTLEENFMPYAMSIIISRAIPEIDGFKPSHRKLLYTMYKKGLINGARTKSANVVGETMKLNPHGDAAIYETMVRLTEGNESLLLPLVDSKGSFGKHYSRDMAYAAARYTEVKLSPVCAEVFKDIDKNTVDFVDNYDGTMKEPRLLPTSFPNILVNPNQGIAAGMASNICSFNLREICNAAIELIKNPDADIISVMPAPDLPTGGEIIYNEEAMREIYRTGRGSFKIRSKYKYDKKQHCIEIYEIPYSTTIEAIIEKIAELIKANKIKEISDVRDETDKNGLKLTIDLKRGTDPDKLMARLFKQTPLQDSFACNFNILIEGSPMVLGVGDILFEWIRFRRSCIKRAVNYDIEKKSEKLHLLEGLEKILLDIDRAIKIIRETEQEDMVIPNLMDGFKIDKVQAEFVAEIKLRNLNREHILKRTAEIESLNAELKQLRETLESKKKIDGVIVKQLKFVASKYGSDRKTTLINEDSIDDAPAETFVDDYQIKLIRTKENYLKKISLVSLRSSGEQKLKEDDEIVQVVETSNTADVLLFTSGGEVYKMKAHDIPDCKASQLGEYMPSMLDTRDSIVGMVTTFDYSGFVMFCFQNGKIAKVELKSYQTKLNRKKLVNAYSTASPVSKILFLAQDTELVAFSSIDKALVFNSASIALKTTRNSGGVNVMTSKKKSIMVDVKPASESGFADLKYYRTKNIPAVGCFIREEDKQNTQLEMEI